MSNQARPKKAWKRDIIEGVRYVDSHIHLDQYSNEQRAAIMQSMRDYQITHLVAVSMNQDSCIANEALAEAHPDRIIPAYGLHPEQPPASEEELQSLLSWMDERKTSIRAIGEVGLPYYLREETEQEGKRFDLAPYEEQLIPFMERAVKWDVPIILHAVYDDATRVCDMLERWNVRKAHFHWFKGDAKTIERMAENGYYVSFTPDIAYEKEIRTLARLYPVKQVMSETDGPWPFEGSFAGSMTEPAMVASVVHKWSELHQMDPVEAAELLWANASRLYGW
ncbi:TatD family hydrolase [Paenibacillus sp. 1001270B_150601_E10]|uniref:TatD family hydrolase n=1 Tax=Paenibacillus sp. 1001270B_150601_E10 TaxID=2787079 RepID=UPI00189DC094|nr:TatD family hydrolase [Paenibacillus sp. 1001270B_150601_E10]